MHDQQKNKLLSLRNPEKVFTILDNIFEVSPDIIYLFNAKEKRHLFISKELESLLGYTHDEISSLGADLLLRSIHPEDLPVVLMHMDNLSHTSSKEIYSIEYRIRGKNGDYVWFYVREKVFRRDEKELPEILFGIVQDITERKKIEEALLVSETNLKKAQKVAHIGSWTWNMKTNQLTWSDEMYRIFGMDKETVALGLNEVIEKAIHPDDQEKVRNTNKKVILEKRATPIEYRIIWPDKTVHTIYAEAGELLTDKDGNPELLTGIAQDITDRKRAEEERIKIEHQLNQVQKLESLGILAGGIAHDFNNLLGGIFAYIDMAAESTTDKTISNYLSKALGTIDRARGLTKQLLTFAKGGMPIKKLEKLSPFIEQTAQFALSGSNVLCKFYIPEDLWPCEFDKCQIGQVIDNLVINAQQAMLSGGTLEIRASNITIDKSNTVLQAGPYVKISFQDTGIGIPNEIISHIFEPFFTTKSKGQGLGLATCYSVINRHDGCIEVESEVGKGSIFTIYLPAQNNVTIEQNINSNSKIQKCSGTIIIMDDEDVIRETYLDMLKMVGYTVICTKNGTEAITTFKSEIIAQRKIVGMIFDLTIPGGIGGKEAIVEIRKIDKNVPVFVASGYADDPVMADPVKYGFTESICKPFLKVELMNMLCKHIKGDL